MDMNNIKGDSNMIHQNSSMECSETELIDIFTKCNINEDNPAQPTLELETVQKPAPIPKTRENVDTTLEIPSTSGIFVHESTTTTGYEELLQENAPHRIRQLVRNHLYKMCKSLRQSSNHTRPCFGDIKTRRLLERKKSK